MNETESKMLYYLNGIKSEIDHRENNSKDIDDLNAKIEALRIANKESLKREIKLRDDLKATAEVYADDETW